MRPLLLAACLALAPAARAAPVPYELPAETAELAPGPNLEVAQANCGACHSADYVSTQPRPLADPRKFWSAEVTKMVKAYKAPVDETDAALIVDYLVATYGK